jgi:HK97 family phage portal protein
MARRPKTALDLLAADEARTQRVRVLSGGGEARNYAGPWRINSAESLLALATPSLTGMAVNENTALSVTTMLACCTVLGESIASLPLKLYRRTAQGQDEERDHPASYLLDKEPNDYQTAFELREQLMLALCLRGNAFARVRRNRFFEPEGLDFVPNENVEVVTRTDRPGVLYRVRSVSRGMEVLERGEVLHLRLKMRNGPLGLSPLTQLRESLGLALATEGHGSATFKNGAAPGLVLEAPITTTAKQLEQIKAELKDTHQGVLNSGKPFVSLGMKPHVLSVSNEDAQFLETRKFQVEEIARAYRVPLVLIGHGDKAPTYASVEQFMISFVQHTLLPYARRWEQGLDACLLTEAEKRQGFYFRFNLNAILRGDFKTRLEGYAKGIETGIFSLNEVRRLEEMDELPDAIGGVHYRPLNSAPASTQPAGVAGDNDED